MTSVGQDVPTVIGAAAAWLRRQLLLAALAAVGALLLSALVVAWLLGAARSWTGTGPGPMLLDVAALLGVLALAGLARRRWFREASESRVAAAAEQARGLPAGSVRGVLELAGAVPRGTSAELARDAEHRVAGLLAGARSEELAGDVGRRARVRRRRALGALLGLGGTVAVLALASPERARAGWMPLLSPVRHMSAAALPAILLQPGNARVPRGGTLDVRIEAPGRTRVVLAWRAKGSVRQERVVALQAARGAAAIHGIDAATRYWVEGPDGAVSDTFTVTPREALLLSGFSYELSFPAYIRHLPERFDGELPPVDVPEGTAISVRGRATRALGTLGLLDPHGVATGTFHAAGRTFSGTWIPAVSGVYRWTLSGADGAPAEFPPSPLEIHVVRDAPPQVALTYPGVDTVLSTDMRQPVAAVATDDHGLSRASMVSWRVGSLGERDSAGVQALALSGDPQRALVQGVLDVSGDRFLPGDTLFYYVRVTDNSPRHQTARTATYRLWLPSQAEMRRDVVKDTKQTLVRATDVARTADQLARDTRSLERTEAGEAAARGLTGPGTSSSGSQAGSARMGYAGSEQARQVLQRQQAMDKEVAGLQQRLEALRKAAQAAGLGDPDLQRRLRQLSNLYQQLLTPALQQELARLKQALQNLDPTRVRQALQALSQDQEAVRKRLEDSLELLRRAATEQQMMALAEDARDLSTQQRSLADAMAQKVDARRAAQQKDLATRADSLHAALDSLAAQLAAQQLASGKQSEVAARAGAAAKAAGTARDAMARAAAAARQDRSSQATSEGRDAAGALDQVAQSLDSTRQQMSAQWRAEAQKVLDQATSDALALAERQNQVLQRMKLASRESPSRVSVPPSDSSGARAPAAPHDPATLRAEQAAVEQGLEALGRNLSGEGRRSALINPDVGVAFAGAMVSLQQSLRVTEGQPGPIRLPVPEAAQSLDALNRLALALLGNQRQIRKSAAATGLQRALQQLAQLAKQQSSLNARTSSLTPLNLPRSAMRKSLRRIAAGQQHISSALKQMNQQTEQKKDLLAQLRELKKESDAIAKALASGKLTPQLRRQQQDLFHHLLDSGQTLERNELSRGRTGQSPGNIGSRAGPPLDAARIGNGIRYPVPSAAQLRALDPEYRRLILEYFERLNRAQPPGGGGR